MAAAPSLAASGRPLPSWYTPSFAASVEEAGAEGVHVSAERLNTECPGVQSPGVGAAGCIVAPAGCTANFTYTDGAPT